MAVDVRLITAAFMILAANTAFAQVSDLCRHMVAIPREPRPDRPEPDFPGMTWNERPLLPAEVREDLCMDTYDTHLSVSLQNIYLDEEREDEVVIARLNYEGNGQPFIQNINLLRMLGPVIRREEETGYWNLIITERQDYEELVSKLYLFTIEVPEAELINVRVALHIVNIDDNPPVVQVFGPCSIPENAELDLTSCVYTVSDADGKISTSDMTFRLDSDRNDGEFFNLVGVNVPNEWMWMYLKLELKTNLNFTENAIHIFRVTALDSLPNTHTVTVMIEVENIESREPRWVERFTMQQFKEKTPQQFTVRAVDGDTGINRPIFYRIETDEPFFRIETIGEGALFLVDPIDRDYLRREVFHATIIAFKNDDDGNEAFSTRADVIIIVDDVNDQYPEPLQEVHNITIREETAITLNLEKFGFNDTDLGEHAQYSVELEAYSPKEAFNGFQIAPQSGYQLQNFIMTTLDHNLLDYDYFEDDVPIFQNIVLKVTATDLNNTTKIGQMTVNINLINWNDEVPIFEHRLQTVRFNETVGAGFFVATVRATDRDVDDSVVHQLLGNAGNYLNIDEETGCITVAIDDAFDYHVQSELFIQVQAVDTLGEPYHSVTSQLVIQLIDINNTPPNLRLPRIRPEVEENVEAGTIIPVEITGTDLDTDAELHFEIDWDSSYATKQGQETPTEEFHGCLEIQTKYPDPDNKRVATGTLIVKNIRPEVTIDFEEFEVLYLTVRVIDRNTEIGLDYDEATLTIIILDMNDNKPLWAEGTLTQAFRVRERSDSGVVIGSVLARDIDGPLYNQVRYTIFPVDDTPNDLVDINFYTGQLTVKTSDAIDADEPRENLLYRLRASDRCYTESCPPDLHYNYNDGYIKIEIIDTNNKVPEEQVDLFDKTVYVYENETTGFIIETIVARDLDRDDIFKTVHYQIDFRMNPRLRTFFAVDSDTGVVTVNYETDEMLDRDGDEPTHIIYFILTDNHLRERDGVTNQETTYITVVLLDINDNAPELPTPANLTWSISENKPQNSRIQPDIYAPDRDDPDTDNSRVGYEIKWLTIVDRDIELPELFTMIQIENVTGELETTRHLQGYWGTYDIHIRAFDHGDPQLCDEETYRLVIRPYNFHDPVFVFPQTDAIIRLARERTSVNGVLVTVQGSFLESIRATDEDGLNAGIVTFHIAENAEAIEYFGLVPDGVNAASLILRKTFEDNIRQFTVTIRGTDGGTEPGSRSSDVTFSLVFMPTQGEPVFDVTTATVSFIEAEGGMLEQFELPHAHDDKNHLCEDDCYTTFYTIIGGNAGGHFTVEPTTNVLRLVTPLDRAESVAHTLQVVATNSLDHINSLSSNTLIVTVNVREANPRPIFLRHLYTAGISVTDLISKVLLTVQATHTEEEAEVTYTIDYSTMVVDTSLEAVKEVAFVLNPTTGVLTLDIQPTPSMHGMFEFDVVATDANDAYDRAEVKIYVISSLNRVIFRFNNTIEQIESNIAFIASTFSIAFNMTCNIDQLLPTTDPDSGMVIENSIEVWAHFIRDNLPVLASEIEGLRGNTVLLHSIRTTLGQQGVVLADLLTDGSPAPPDSARLAVYVLAGLTTLLGFICLVLLFTFIIRTRTLNRRLEALSVPIKFGSIDSGLNRVGKTPGTNMYADAGSNPIWNETIKAPNFDTLSNASNDSDLIGIEDLPQFQTDYFPSADDFDGQGIVNNELANRVTSHNNNFGFKANPFSPEFGNRNVR